MGYSMKKMIIKRIFSQLKKKILIRKLLVLRKVIDLMAHILRRKLLVNLKKTNLNHQTWMTQQRKRSKKPIKNFNHCSKTPKRNKSSPKLILLRTHQSK